MEARAATRSTWSAGQHMGAHVALLGVGCMRRVGACACAMTRERRTKKKKKKKKKHGPAYSMAPLSVGFHVFRCMFHVFRLGVASRMLQSEFFICFRRMVQVFF
jgi:hypothetical protein